MKQFDCLRPGLNIEGYHSLEASAGTGKTFAIQHLVARFILENVKIDEILVVTFTKASTRELKSRIRSNLASLFEQQPAYLSSLSSDEKIAAQGAVAEALACFDRSHIFTIHGFCQRMLLEHGFELGLGAFSPDAEEIENQSRLIQEITDVLHTSLPPSEYSTKQLAVLMDECNHDKDILVKKVLHLIESKKECLNLPDYTASRHQFLTFECEKPPIETVLQLAPAFLYVCDRQKKLKKRFLEQYQAFLAKDFDALLTHPSLFAFFRKDNRSKRAFKEEMLRPLYVLGEVLHPLIREAFDPRYTLMRIAKKIESHIKTSACAHDILSPDDLLIQMKTALANAVFHLKVRSRYQVVIIDEFQDTDPDQWAIFKSLFVDKPVRAFYLVADPKQSIYGFRSADLNTYFQAKSSMDQTAHLTTNYRCHPHLLRSLNLLFSKQSRFPYTPVEPPVNALNFCLEDGKNALHFFTATLSKNKTRSPSSSSHLETAFFFPFIAREITSLVNEGKASFKDFAILVKDRFQAARITSFLEKLNIPLRSKSGESLRTTLAFSFMESLLKALIDPKKVRPLLAHPLYQFTHHEIREGPNAEIVAFLNGQKGQPFHRMIQSVLHYHWKPDHTLIELVVQNGRLDTYSDLMQIVEMLLKRGKEASFEQLLDDLMDVPDTREYCRSPLADENAVIIMTIHASKGLEFPIVFALGLIQRNNARREFIHYQNKWRIFSAQCAACQATLQRQEEEKIRQLYVAMTRAKRRLYVPVLKDHEIPLSGAASPLELFLSDLPSLDELIPTIGATQTVLEPQLVHPFCAATPVIHPPLVKQKHSPRLGIYSFSSFNQSNSRFFAYKTINSTESLPRGIETGLFFHSLLEKIVRQKLTHPYRSSRIHSLIKTAVLQTKLSPYLPEIKDLIYLAFHSPLDGFCIADIPPHHLHTEVEFFYIDTPNAHVKGFIDLIFLYNKAYYILDWKMHDLPDYTLAGLRKVMEQSGYFLQASIYTQALRRYLTLQADPYPIAGCYYLFLRGLARARSFYFIPESGSKAISLLHEAPTFLAKP